MKQKVIPACLFFVGVGHRYQMLFTLFDIFEDGVVFGHVLQRRGEHFTWIYNDGVGKQVLQLFFKFEIQFEVEFGIFMAKH